MTIHRILANVSVLAFYPEDDGCFVPANADAYVITREGWNKLAIGVDLFFANISDEEIERHNTEQKALLEGKMTGNSQPRERKVKEPKKYFCPYCEKSYWDNERPMHRDHIIPKSRGGRTRKNIVKCCDRCNINKFKMTPWEWLGDGWLPPAGYETVFAYAYATRVDPLAIC